MQELAASVRHSRIRARRRSYTERHVTTLGNIARHELRDDGRDVHVWLLDRARANEIAADAAGVLSDDERQRAARYQQTEDRDRFESRRAVLRAIIGSYTGCAAERIVFRVNRLGRPVLQFPRASWLRFSVSQTEGLALLAFARGCRIGVDAQRIDPTIDAAAIARQVFCATELAVLAATNPHAHQHRFFTTWARKEALLKAFGIGFLGEAERWRTEDVVGDEWNAWRGNGVRLTGWTLRDLSLAADVRAALAVSQAPVTITCMRV